MYLSLRRAAVISRTTYRARITITFRFSRKIHLRDEYRAGRFSKLNPFDSELLRSYILKEESESLIKKIDAGGKGKGKIITDAREKRADEFISISRTVDKGLHQLPRIWALRLGRF